MQPCDVLENSHPNQHHNLFGDLHQQLWKQLKQLKEMKLIIFPFHILFTHTLFLLFIIIILFLILLINKYWWVSSVNITLIDSRTVEQVLYCSDYDSKVSVNLLYTIAVALL